MRHTSDLKYKIYLRWNWWIEIDILNLNFELNIIFFIYLPFSFIQY